MTTTDTNKTSTEKLIPWGSEAYKTADQAYMLMPERVGEKKFYARTTVYYTCWTTYDCRGTKPVEIDSRDSLKEALAALARLRGVGRIILPRASKKTV